MLAAPRILKYPISLASAVSPRSSLMNAKSSSICHEYVPTHAHKDYTLIRKVPLKRLLKSRDLPLNVMSNLRYSPLVQRVNLGADIIIVKQARI